MRLHRVLAPAVVVALAACVDTPPVDSFAEPDDSVALGLNDVSVLFPLPAGGDDSWYLRPTDDGGLGQLLPQDVFDEVPTFPVTPADGLDYDLMRAVSVRFDMCGGQPEQCNPQIRLVMQTIAGDTTRDSAMHLFYALADDDEAKEVVDALRRLRALAPEADVNGPLDVHPALLAQGVDGAYGTALRELLMAHMGADNFVQVTFFLRAPPVDQVWFFGGFKRNGETLTQIPIDGAAAQRVILTEDTDIFTYDLSPAGTTPEDGSTLQDTNGAARAGDDARRAALSAFLRVESPSAHGVDELPCAGCHIATYVTTKTAEDYGLDLSDFADRYTSPGRDLSLNGHAARDPSSLRAFGYFGRDPMIAQRTVNESAFVLDDIDARFAE